MRKVRLITAIILVMMLALPSFALAVEEGDTQPQGMKDMSDDYEGEDKYGYTSGLITLIYEDENGQEYSEEIKIYININGPVIRNTKQEPVEEPERAGQWWISLIIGGIVILGLAVYLLINRNRRVKEDKINIANEVEV